jgi:hypothetical protein
MASQSLRARLARVRRRLLLIGSSSAVFWGFQAGAVLLLAVVWLDLVWELSPAWRVATLCVSGAAGFLGIVALTWRAARSGRTATLARQLDKTAATGGQILTGIELDAPPRSVSLAGVSAGLAQLAVDRAASLAGEVPLAKAVPARPLGRAAGSLTGLLAAVGLLCVCLPELARTEWNRFTNPWADVPPYSRTRFEVTPGDVAVPYGGELEVRAAVRGAPVDQVELVLEKGEGQKRGQGDEDALPMFPEPDGRWRAVLAKVTAPAVYHVRSYRARSERYQIRVITIPRIEAVRLRITPPAYTSLPPYEGPLPKEGVAGLPGTEVRIWARSNRPLSGGVLTVTGREQPIRVSMKPAAEEAHDAIAPPPPDRQEVAGHFRVDCDGKFSLYVVDVDGQRSQESFDGGISLLADAHPFIRLVEPQKRSLATPNAALPVVAAAEDDYGISRVELYRSLNDSRALPAAFRLAERPPRRVYETAYLPLARYGLRPGDAIKLFGRVEDNDPAGAKGSESPVATVEIISQKEFERLLRLRQGLEVLMSKYRQAERRMEGLADEIEKLRKELEGEPPNSAIAQDRRERLQRLVQSLREQSEAIRKLTETKLPYDVDERLAPQLETLARVPEELAEQLAKLLEQGDLDNQKLAQQLANLAARLAAGRGEFDQSAMAPLEQLEAVFPLMADQSRFVTLVLRQMDLAERLAALKGHDGEDNPALKIRMRDLEQEQREIREELAALLDDIEDHVERLPDEMEFDRLRQTALKFADDLRASGAAEAMSGAESALAEFSGTRAHEKAQEAADILQKFLKMCQGGEGMGTAAGACLVFQPTLANCLGNTVEQLLAEMGLGGGGKGGMGMGSGGTGGYSSRRGGFGLYGGMPGMTGALGGDYGASGNPDQNPPGGLVRELPGGANPDEAVWPELSAGAGAGGLGEADVPVRYRRRVGEYFRRIIDELGGR